MVARSRTGSTTFAEFFELISEDQKADLIDGVIYMASPENVEHNDLVGWLFIVMRQYVSRRRLGTVTVNRVAYRLASRTSPEPDIGFVTTQLLGIVKHGFVDGPPDVAVELVSPDSVDRDYDLKRRHYEQAGVREYWIIDPAEKRATFLLRCERGFVDAPLHDGVFSSATIPGFRLDPRWLWQRPLPDSLDIVQSLLAGSP